MSIKIEKLKEGGIYYYSERWMEFTSYDSKYNRELLKCISIFRPDMYFYYLYRFIIRYNFENKGIESNLEKIKTLYIQASSYILEEKCSLKLQEIYQPLNFNWEDEHINYSNEIEYFKSSILGHISFNNETMSTLKINEDDNPFFADESSKFFQDVMFFGFLMSLNRIESEIDNLLYFGGEVINYGNETDLIIYLTPHGMVNYSNISKLGKDERVDFFLKFLDHIKITRIRSNDLKEKYKTQLIVDLNGELFYHTKYFYGQYNNYMNERINRSPISSILIEGQTNLRKIP